MEIDTPKTWFVIPELIAREKGKVLVLGATDTGKSTLIKFLVSRLCPQGLEVALIDTDIGQSSLGPPATIGFSLFKSHPDWGIILSAPEIFFVGFITPEGHFSIFLSGIEKMLNKAMSSGADVILLDTTGFISGEAGIDLKRRKIDLVSPRFILALQKSDEIEPILKPFKDDPGLKIIRLPVSEKVRPRSMEERKIYRNDRFQDFFRHAAIHEFNVEEIRIEGQVLDPNGEVLPLDWALNINGLLIGLKDHQEETLSLGLIRNYSKEKKVLRIFTPLHEIQDVKTIQLSSLKVIL